MLVEKKIFQVGFAYGFPPILVAADDVTAALEMGEEWSLGIPPAPGVVERKIVAVKRLGNPIIYDVKEEEE